MKTLTTQKKSLINQKGKLDLLIDKFFRQLDVGERTREAYKKGLSKFLGYLDKNKFNPLAREHILTWKKDLKETYSPQSINLFLSSVRSFFSWLEAEKIYPNIAGGIKGYKRPRGHLKNALTKIEARRLIDGIPREKIIGLRDFALTNLMLRTGVRQEEIINADIQDMEKKGGVNILRVKGKGRDEKDDFVILTDESYNPLMDYLKARKKRQPEEPLFISHSNHSNIDKRLTTRAVRKFIADRLRRAGLKDKKTTTHSLRHTFGSLAIEGGANVISVQESMRHTNINTTMKYVHSRKRIELGAEKYIDF